MVDDLKKDLDNTGSLPEDTDSSQISPDIPGKVSAHIGTGKHAKAAIVWETIKWSFLAGTGITLILVGAALAKIYTFSIEDLKMTWGIFIPIITLALGYIFGKGKE